MVTNGSAAQPLIVRHRPATFEEVMGHGDAVASLQRRITGQGRPHAYLFTGPSGTGKTTLARIVATHLGSAVMEIDAASNSGVDAMRALVEVGSYRAFNAATRMIILDECHRLSRPAFDAALKLIEEPPDHLYLALCTTELTRVPETIVTRCYHVRLARLPDTQIENFVIDIAVREGWDETLDPDVFRLVVSEANGSPRRALTLLQSVYDAPSAVEARRIIAISTSVDPMRQVLAMLLSGQGGWDAIRPLLAIIRDDEEFDAESLVHAARYVMGAMEKEESVNKAKKMWELLAALTYPAESFDAKAIFYAAVGRYLWSGV